ncbi:HSP20-like chaperone [Xylariomycetidae sp. FL0641]|nr:HSP20-like chaperone [Xylariomycetidae sp. FL0641]
MQSYSRTLPRRIIKINNLKPSTTCKRNIHFTPQRTMSLFGHPYYHVPERYGANDLGGFGSLVRFIDDWDKHVQQTGEQPGRKGLGSRLQSFTPKFDMKETETAFELHGELPGIEKENVNIEFTDAQTITIHGKVERTRTEGKPPAGLLEGGEKSSEEQKKERSDSKSYQPTVEDEKEDGSSTKVAESGKRNEQGQQQPQEPGAKYWVYERSIGDFSRSFAFPSRVDPEAVSASLNNGVLHVVVPKAKKPENKRITIQ